MLLELKDVWIHYHKVAAVKGISIAVEEGGIVTLIGANGAGKSTTLRTISGLKRASAGEIEFAGERIDRVAPEKVTKMGIAHVPEGRRVFPYMSVVENLEMGAYLRTDKRAIEKGYEEVFEHFPRLRERRKQQAGTLSGGEQQMLAIGRALMSRPRLMLFDEPSLGLAPNLVETTFEIIAEIRAQGVTVLMVEQNAYAALELCDRSYLLESGEVTLTGSGEDLLNDPHVKEAYLGG